MQQQQLLLLLLLLLHQQELQRLELQFLTAKTWLIALQKICHGIAGMVRDLMNLKSLRLVMSTRMSAQAAEESRLPLIH